MPPREDAQSPDARRTFSDLYETHGTAVFNFLRRFLPRGNGADDCFQETFARLWRMLPRYREEGRGRAFLLTIARNVALDHLERRKRDRDATATLALDGEGMHWDEAPGVSQQEISAIVRAKIAELPESQRETFLLYRYDNLSYAEIARIQGVGVKTVESRLYRAMKQLGRSLRPYRHLSEEESPR
ncbi:MAG: RNA polymerase sigma factor [Planctomycetes bacterium]|nr:RNA polymerase sigma factor [Planctomycetota bacterium]